MEANEEKFKAIRWIKHGKGDTKALQKAFKSVRTSITPKG